MRICQVCSGHNVDDGRTFHRTSVALAEAGHDVHLITTGPGDRPYVDRGVTIHPLSKPRNRLERLRRRYMVARMAIALDPEVLQVHEPELLGPVIARAGSRPVIWDVHESYTDILMDRHWVPRFARAFLSSAWDRHERRLLKHCAAVVAVTNGVAERYRKLHPVVCVIANFPEITDFSRFTKTERKLDSCVFTGTIAPNRGLEFVFRALALLKNKGLAVPFHIAGKPTSTEYLESLLAEGERLGIGDLVSYHGYIAKERSVELQLSSGIGIVAHLPMGNNLIGWPVKMLEFMAAGLPLVYTNMECLQELVDSAQAGIAVESTSPEAIAGAIETLVRDPELSKKMGEAGRKAVLTELNWRAESVKLLQLYDTLGAKK